MVRRPLLWLVVAAGLAMAGCHHDDQAASQDPLLAPKQAGSQGGARPSLGVGGAEPERQPEQKPEAAAAKL